jgi:hypothetical protein
MTLIKYTPQALLNAQRCSTEGWSINNVLLDLSGGLLSFAQVGLNAFARGDISVITGVWDGASRLALAFSCDFCCNLGHNSTHNTQGSPCVQQQGSHHGDQRSPMHHRSVSAV